MTFPSLSCKYFSFCIFYYTLLTYMYMCISTRKSINIILRKKEHKTRDKQTTHRQKLEKKFVVICCSIRKAKSSHKIISWHLRFLPFLSRSSSGHPSRNHEEEATWAWASELRCGLGSPRYRQQRHIRHGLFWDAPLFVKSQLIFYVTFLFRRSHSWDIQAIPWHSRSWGSVRFTWRRQNVKTAVNHGCRASQQGEFKLFYEQHGGGGRVSEVHDDHDDNYSH